MKTLILIAALLSTGCATLDYTGDPDHEARVREWITIEVNSIYQKRNKADEMLLDNKISHYEHALLMERYDKEKRSIPYRVPF